MLKGTEAEVVNSSQAIENPVFYELFVHKVTRLILGGGETWFGLGSSLIPKGESSCLHAQPRD
jgi:hypothetical protein